MKINSTVHTGRSSLDCARIRDAGRFSRGCSLSTCLRMACLAVLLLPTTIAIRGWNISHTDPLIKRVCRDQSGAMSSFIADALTMNITIACENDLRYVGVHDMRKAFVKGAIYSGKELLYQGRFLDGRPHDQGTLYSEGSPIFLGRFHHGKVAEGGLYINGSLIFQGNWNENGFRHGTGEQISSNGIICRGNWTNGKKDGQFFCWNEKGKIATQKFKDGKAVTRPYIVDAYQLP